MTLGNAQLATRALTAEITKKVRERGLVLWVDAEKHYTPFVDALTRPGSGFSYPVVTLRGSYLELMLALEPYGNGLQPEHVLVHLPGLNKETVKETPVYELYKAGKVFEKSLGTLVREAAVGVARPEDLEAFLRLPGLTVEKADDWLASLRGEPKDRLTLLLESLGIDDVALGLVADDPRLRAHLTDGGPQILVFLEKGLGLTSAWRTFRIGDSGLTAAAVQTLTASWLMAVEFVHDLKESPVMPELRALTRLGPVAKECRRLATRFRQQHPDIYEQFANELQEQLAHERTSHHAAALGSIDTFRFEEATTRAAAIGALARGDWDTAQDLAEARTPSECFWVQRSQSLQRTWEVIRLAAATGRALAGTASALRGSGSLEEAVERYAGKLSPVDRHHRVFEQRAHALLASDLEDYDGLLEVRRAVRRAYRDWANAINRAFFDLCGAHGVLPGRSLRQRSIYEEVVHPLLERGERVAFVLVDALRFEMAQAFAQDLKAEKYQINLTPRLAELPTETRIGMNALAPIAHNGRLRAVMRDGSITGFKGGETIVNDPKTRVRAMSDWSLKGLGMAESIELEEFQELTVTQIKRRLAGKPALVVVHSRELDTAGEHGLHLGTFEQSLALLKSALSLLQQAGVERFVISSDHGFLLQDATADNVPFGVNKRVPERRHALLPEPSGMPDVLEVRLSDLEYDVAEDPYLVFRPDTALWQTQTKVAPFVHGGNSLQERVIPVLVVERQAVRGKTISRYEVAARAEPAHLGRQRLRLAVRLQTLSSASLGFHGPRTISLALRVPGRSDVTLRVLDAGPPATLAGERVLVPPNKEEALIEFELEGQLDEKVRVEVFHPDATEQVEPKVVEGFFDVNRDRRLGKPRVLDDSLPPAAPAPPAAAAAVAQGWTELVTDEAHRRVLQIIAESRTINEAELEQVLGSPRRVRAFARQFDDLVRLVPFEIEVLTVQGMKAYVRKD